MTFENLVVKRFVLDSSLNTLIKVTVIYSIILILFSFLTEKIRLNNEVRLGLVNELEPTELLRNDLNRYWLYRLHQSNPKLGKMFWDWKNDQDELMKGNLEYLNKYNLLNLQQVNDISNLVTRIYKIEDKIWGKWERDMNHTLILTKKMLKANNLPPDEIDDIIKKYSDPDVEKNLKLLISYLIKVSKQ